MRSQLIFSVGIFVLTTSGCLYNGGYPYGYYGPGPTMMPAQPMNAYPPGAYPTYNTNPTPMGAPYTPSNQPAFGQPTPIDSNQPSAPNTFKGGDNGTNYTAPQQPQGTVPPPGDDPSNNFPASSNTPSLSPTSSTSRSARTNEDLQTPFEQESSTRLPRDFANETAEADETVFESPTVKQVSHEADPQIPYGHSPKFDWLQGYVEYDEPTKTWVIIYTDSPDGSDQLGGEATLADHPSLRSLKDGQIVRVDGRLDATMKDVRNRPLYRVSKLKLIPMR